MMVFSIDLFCKLIYLEDYSRPSSYFVMFEVNGINIAQNKINTK